MSYVNSSRRVTADKDNDDGRQAQLPQRNIASATRVILGWLTDRAIY